MSGEKRSVAGLLGLFLSFQVFAFPISVSQAPRDDIYLTLHAIGAAKSSLLVNIYEMKSKEVGDALVERIRAGVHVEILEEGQPVGQVSPQATDVRQRIVEAMQDASAATGNRFYSMSEANKKLRRFTFDHAKYMVIDDQQLLIGSENYSSSLGEPDHRPGNRGWEVLLQNPDLAAQYKTMFASDSAPSNEDIVDLVDQGRGRSLEQDGAMASFAWQTGLQTGGSLDNPVPDGAITQLEAQSARSLTSPDTSLSGLVGLLNQASKSVKLELMTFNPKWGIRGEVSPLYTAVVEAARRGVSVRVLLNDEDAFGSSSKARANHKHPYLVRMLKQLAQNENLDLDARIANLGAMNVTYIHNKGALVDGTQVLISSINWNENSVEHNRETAAIVESADVNQYYDQLFETDWQAR
jgi:phosphatidylserine/phosphatidylglycerophosphate/cardiolipin synthase-like enzyme